MFRWLPFAVVLIYRKFNNSYPGTLRHESGIVGRGAVKDAAVPRSDASEPIFVGYEA